MISNKKISTKHVEKKETPLHALIRVKSEDGKTIKAHSDLIRKNGSALLGKIGQPLAADFIATLNKQTKAGNKTYLFLAKRDGWNGPYVIYQCELSDVTAFLPETKKNLVPTYYSCEFQLIKTWFEIKTITKMNADDMKKIYVLSSGREITSVLNSSASVFRVGLSLS